MFFKTLRFVSHVTQPAVYLEDVFWQEIFFLFSFPGARVIPTSLLIISFLFRVYHGEWEGPWGGGVTVVMRAVGR